MYWTATTPRLSRGRSTPAIRAMGDSSALPLLVTGILADHPHGPVPAHDLAVLAPQLDRRLDFHDCPLKKTYLNRYVIRPRVRSYGDSSTLTLSPGRIRMKFMRILPETWAST